MPRLIDECIARGVRCKTDSVTSGFWDTLTQAEVFKIDNIAKYYFDLYEEKQWSVADFPNVAPPFDCYWMEFKGVDYWDTLDPELVPRQIHGKCFESCGVLVRALMPNAKTLLFGENGNEVAVKWATQYTFVVKHERFDVPKVSARVIAALNERGEFVGWDKPSQMQGEVFEDDISDEGKSNLLYFMARMILLPTFLATSFLHCKNVKQIVGEIAPKVAKKYKAKTGRDLVQFKTLDIAPMRETLRRASAEDADMGLKRALHVCRGHFATYTADRPLFGKRVGTFWVPQHIRGKSEYGAVVKDYRLVH